MELIRGIHQLRPRHRGCVATIGAFDGVHRGHQSVLNSLIKKGREFGLPTAVVIFEPLPREYFSPDQAPPRLMSFREKFEALRDLGVDRVLCIRFNDALRDMGAKEFSDRVFVNGLGVKFIVVGDDLRFGRDRAGGFNQLRELGKEIGFDVSESNTLTLTDDRVSSSRIRQALYDADFELAEELLGSPYSISGRVMLGQQLGRQLGVPTANVHLKRIQAAMAGVYAVEVEGIDGSVYKGVANVGLRPTVGDLLKPILEVNILDFSGDIYGKRIKVIFRHKLRDEMKFDSLELLKENIQKDIADARSYFLC